MAESPVEKLRRWELSGATWRVERRSEGSAEVELHGGLMGRLTSGDPALLDFPGRSRRGGGGQPWLTRWYCRRTAASR